MATTAYLDVKFLSPKPNNMAPCTRSSFEAVHQARNFTVGQAVVATALEAATINTAATCPTTTFLVPKPNDMAPKARIPESDKHLAEMA